MPSTYRVLFEGSLVIEKWVGDISHSELVSHECEMSRDTAIESVANVLVDARLANFASSREQIESLREVYEHPEAQSRNARCALLVSTEAWHQARQYEALMQDFGVNVICFTALPIACTWLGYDVDRISGLLDELLV